MMGYSVLVIDDDRAMRASLQELLEAAGWHATLFSRADYALGKLGEISPDVILSDVRMPVMTGLEFLDRLDTATAPPLVLISAHGDIPTAVKAMQDGAYSFVEKPYEPRRLLSILDHAASQHRMRKSTVRLKAQLARLSGIDKLLLGQTDQIAALREDILDLADAPTPVFLTGETGTGKDLVARALHDLGPRSDGPFVALNCAAIAPDRFEQEMFGIANESLGLIRAADGGTLFLDEISSCPAPVQAKLLRVIESKEVTPLGATQPAKVDFRVVSASGEDPDLVVSEGRLRADLYYRLNTVVLSLPPLRNRADDLVLLFTRFLQDAAHAYEISPPEISHEDVTALLAHDWPGNVRELRQVAERRVMAARRGVGSVAQAMSVDQSFDEVPPTLREAVAVYERELIGKAVTAHQGRMDAVAEALGIGRRTLNEKIVKLGLDKDALL